MKSIRAGFAFGNNKIYNNLGGSPSFIISLSKWLDAFEDQIQSIDVALYLFNNRELYKILEKHANRGCAINIYTIPLEGYDNDYPIEIKHHTGNVSLGKKTKYDLASELYSEISEAHNENIHLRIVPHMYLRSKRVRPFSRGSMPYSLHCKTCCVHLKDGRVYAGLTSSNLAVRDAQKHEIATIAQLDRAEIASVEDFFLGLWENSIDYDDFCCDDDFSHFETKMRNTPPKSRLMFTAPFYANSAVYFEDNIRSIVSQAKHRIIVCAQHVCSFDYFYENAYTAPGAKTRSVKKHGFLHEVIRKAKAGVPTQILSQTYADETGSHGCRAPENKKSFIDFVSAARGSCEYYVNPNIHCKFIIVDDHVLITTCNFTPTQFIYLPSVSIDHFDNIPGYSYSGIHCEYGVYCVISNHDFAEQILKDYDSLKHHKDTKRMF